MRLKQKIALYLLFSGFFLYGQTEEQPFSAAQLPEVFLIGQYEDLYPQLYEEYPGFLLNVTQNNMNAAFEKWLNMIYAMEAHSERLNFDIKGLKIWINVFFDPSGQIDHFLYYKKPYSRNIDDKELNAFFRSFIKNYRMEVSSDQPFSHSGSATFPSFGSQGLEVNR